jgi:UDP-N-acetylglucosamine 2-epimerase (non-hydrolysing)
MIAVVYGTTGELIKLAPVLVRLRERGAAVLTVCTGQQAEQIPALLDDLELPQPNIWLGRGNRGHDLERRRDLPAWFAQVGGSFVRRGRELRTRILSAPTNPLLMVHGDTMTTVLGALMGRAMRLPVAHVEAGMRSGDWRNPFPEELDRLAAARLARIHFAPGSHAAANLRAMNVRGAIVDTGGNTIRDALDLVPAAAAAAVDLPREPFGLVSLHRSELLGNPVAFRGILALLHEVSRRTPILFVDHPVTVAAISKHTLDSLFDERFRRVPRQRYFTFIALLKMSAFLVTDSGGSQQECAQLGHPCLVHRAVTEHPDGLNGSVVLSRMDLDVARTFLAHPWTHASEPPLKERLCPTDVIIDYLVQNGYLYPASMDGPTPVVDGA